jgi:hypothetical protein
MGVQHTLSIVGRQGAVMYNDVGTAMPVDNGEQTLVILWQRLKGMHPA